MSPFLVSMLGGILGLLALVVLIFAIRISYAIERVTKPRPEGSLPRYTNIFASAFGYGVAPDDAATWAKVKRLRMLLGLIALMMGGMAISLSMFSPTPQN